MKVHETYDLAHRWKQCTGIDLRQFVDIFPWDEVLPNTEALERLVQPDEDESVAEALERRYGKAAVSVIEELFEKADAPEIIATQPIIKAGTQLRMFWS